jgi:hypothetical protein
MGLERVGGFLSMFRSGHTLTLTLNQRVQSSSLRRPTKTYLVAGLCIIWQSGATRIINPRVGQVRLPNEPNQSVSYFLRVFRVTGQILVQKPLLIKKPPYEDRQRKEKEEESPPGSERKRYAGKHNKSASVHRVSNNRVWAG